MDGQNKSNTAESLGIKLYTMLPENLKEELRQYVISEAENLRIEKELKEKLIKEVVSNMIK